MTSKINSATVIGLDATLIEVESDIASGLPSFSIVGLPDKAVEEAKDRVRSALKNSSLGFPRTRITVNLAPADIKKTGVGFDLPIALSILAADGKIDDKALDKTVVVGELSLNGRLRPVPGILPIVIAAKKSKAEAIIVPIENSKEASLVSGIKVIGAESLGDLIAHFIGERLISETLFQAFKPEKIKNNEESIDFSQIQGQEHAKRALEIAAAGHHNVLFCGPPGSGKSLLAQALATILPPLTEEESLEVTKIHSIIGEVDSSNPLLIKRPFRNPHHTASAVSLVGGGSYPRPGEITLAHRGVLFLDELPEFPRQVLEVLRQPLESGYIQVSRSKNSVMFPARFLLVAAQNPCPCGYNGFLDKNCVCSAGEIAKYQKKVSGPLLDRIDLHIEVPRQNFEKLTSDKKNENSTDVLSRISRARKIQLNRFKGEAIFVNGEMAPRLIKKHCELDAEGKKILKNAVDSLGMSARGYHRVLRVSRTIADLERSHSISHFHLAEALQYRKKDED